MSKKLIYILLLGSLTNYLNIQAMQESPKVLQVVEEDRITYMKKGQDIETVCFRSNETGKISCHQDLRNEKARAEFANLEKQYSESAENWRKYYSELTKEMPEETEIYKFENQNVVQYRKKIPNLGQLECILNKQSGNIFGTYTMNKKASIALFYDLKQQFQKSN